MSVIYSFMPNKISLSTDWQQPTIYMTPNGGEEQAETSKYIPTVDFYNRIKEYFSDAWTLTTINLKGFYSTNNAQNRSTGIGINATVTGTVTQDFELYAFQNKLDTNFYFYFYCPSYLTSLGEPAGLSIAFIWLNEKASYIYNLGLYAGNTFQFLDIYTINKNLIILKPGTSSDGGFKFIVFNNKDIIHYQDYDRIYISNNELPGTGTEYRLPYPAKEVINYVAMVPLKSIDYVQRTDPKEVYLETYGNKVNETFRKNGIDYLCFGKNNDERQAIIISSKALGLE